MQIYTVEDQDFPVLLDALKSGTAVGKYERNGKVHLVFATKQFMMIASENDETKIAIKPCRSITESASLALQYLKNERARGGEVHLEEEFGSSESNP